MQPHLSLVAAAATAAAVAALGIVITDQVIADQAPVARKSVVEIVEKLEKEGYRPSIEFSFDDGYWEVETYKDGTPYELAVDAHTGEVRAVFRDVAARHIPHNAEDLPKILHGMEAKGYGAICEVSFERGLWEIESLRGSRKFELVVDPKTGSVISNRPEG